jgi:hypothetical protein
VQDRRPVEAPGARRWIAVTVLVLLGGGLRALNLATAFVHPDENHYAEDASWLVAPLPLRTGIHFLRDHPGVHYRLSPDTGALTPWPTTGPNLLGGHLPLHAYVAGLAIAVVRPTSRQSTTLVARGVDVVADTTTIALLPALVTVLGGSAAAGLAAAALYAVFPPAIVYGSLANLDPFLAPLLVALLVVVLRASDRHGRWIAAGVLTGLLACAKQPGLLAFGLVPLLGWRHPRGLVIWAVTAAVVVVSLVSPTAYLQGLRQPSDPYLQLRFEPLAFVAGNLVALSQPATWYWFSFNYHGRPLAYPFAHVHQVVTPIYLLGYALALPALASRGRWRALLTLFGPTAFLLSFIQPSNGTSRFHMVAPLVCGAIALAANVVPRRGLFALAALAILVALAPLLPSRPGADGAVDLGDVLFWNPQAPQRYGFYSPLKGRSIVVQVEASVPLSRRLWLPAGTYEVGVRSDGPVDVTLDGQPAITNGAGRGPVTVGRVPRIALSTPTSARLKEITVRPAPTASPPP